jgi:hypothetical protein
VFALCLPIVLLVAQVWKPWAGGPQAVPLAVPTGDQEVAWIHTTTNAATWERFVTGVVRSAADVPGLTVDDSRAFLESTTAVPELVLSRAGHEGKLHIRWYKLQSEVSTADWVKALAARTPAPVAVIGGGSTDRAIQLAEAMSQQAEWKGDRPPLLITTATADFDMTDDSGGVPLVDLYDDRTFRFCFTNRQMAEAVVRFVFDGPEASLRPPPNARVPVVTVSWGDDRYSVDLRDQFTAALTRRFAAPGRLAVLDHSTIPFSVGGYLSPNPRERDVAEFVADRLRSVPDERVILVLPSTTQPARRLLKAIVETEPRAAGKLVVVTGDGLPLNTVLRDAEFSWPTAALPVPLVFFAHNNPVAWDKSAATAPPGYAFRPPNGTEEEMHFGELAKVLAEACFPANHSTATRGDELVARLRARTDFFDPNGERNANAGEHVLVVMPGRRPTLTVWRQGANGGWQVVPGTPVALPAGLEDRP